MAVTHQENIYLVIDFMNVPSNHHHRGVELLTSEQACGWYRTEGLACTSIKLAEGKEANERLLQLKGTQKNGENNEKSSMPTCCKTSTQFFVCLPFEIYSLMSSFSTCGAAPG